MIDKQKAKELIEGYKFYFQKYFERESYKWKAVKSFQDNWKIDEPDFGTMFKRATSATSDLLASGYFYPATMIVRYAQKDSEATRTMFRNLYDETMDLAIRMQSFMDAAKELHSKYAAENQKNDFQNTNAISTYLWLKYPDKYYIYRYEFAHKTAKAIGADYAIEKGSIDSVIDCFRMYDEISAELKEDEELREMIQTNMPTDCYSDPEFHTMVIDFCFYIGRYYDKDGWMGTDFDTGIGVEEWTELLHDRSIFNDTSLQIMKRMKSFGGAATCIQLALRYGEQPGFYSMGSTQLAKRIIEKTKCKDSEGRDNKFWPILYIGKYASEDSRGEFIWRIRDELSEALDSIDLDGVNLFSTRGNADYLGILEYLDKYREQPYNTSLSGSEGEPEENKEIREKGESIVRELSKIADYYSKTKQLDCCAPITWLDGSETKTSRGLQISLKKQQFKDQLVSLKIVAEYNPQRKSYFRVSLDLENDKAEDFERNQFHSYLEKPIADERLCLTAKCDEWGNPIVLNEPIEDIRQKIQNGDYRKVQLSSYIYRGTYDQSITELSDQIYEVVESILPYYELAVQSKELSIGGVNMEFDKNMILCGPPGTGKTYSTAIYAVGICDGLSLDEVKKKSYSDIMVRYKELKEEGRIAFTTFHQSYGYEEFIEGIKPVLGDEESDVRYRIEPGVFNRFCQEARGKAFSDESGLPDVRGAKVWCVLLDGTGVSTLKKNCFEENTIRIGWSLMPKDIDETTGELSSKERRILMNFQYEMEIGDLVVVERSNMSIDGIGIVTGEYEFEEGSDWPRKRQVKWLMTGKEINIFELNGSIRLDRKSVYPLYRVSPDSILALIEKEEGIAIKEETRPYVFIIDEINRGNISKVFGELITLIEDTKREGMPEAISAKLPYSGKPFSVPNNVYILGTMNTADRSIALMDTALRRRFRFIENMPDIKVLREQHADFVEKLDVAQMLKVMNERIEVLYDREHTIGHAYFIPLKDNLTKECLGNIFKKSIIPLLQEYFYEDYEKIQLVLGDNAKTDEDYKFIKKVSNTSQAFKGNYVPDIEAKYEINEEAFKHIESYMEIL